MGADIVGFVCGVGILTGVLIAASTHRRFEDVFTRKGEGALLAIFGAVVMAQAIKNILEGM
jgi:hypothetical protein